MARNFLIPNFLFYSNKDNLTLINKSYTILKKKQNEIFNTRKTINFYFYFYNFTLIYFYIGNFFIKNKLNKSIKNIINIGSNYYQVSDINLNLYSNLNFFFNNLEAKSKNNINKSIFLINNKYFLPKDIITLCFSYFKLVYIYMGFFKKFINFFNIKFLNLNITLKDSFNNI